MADDSVTTEAPTRPGPALAATSDAPVVTKSDTPPVDTEVNAMAKSEVADAGAEIAANAVDTGEQDEETVTGADEAGADAEASTAKAGKEKIELPPFAKREITKARNQKREADARAEAAEKLAAERDARLDTALKALADKAEKSKAVAETPRPKRDTFDNPDAYEDALIAWSASNAARAAAAEVEARVTEQSEAGRKARENADRAKDQEARQASWTEKRDSFIKDHPDYEDVAESDDVKISLAMSQVILDADNGPELAYALGKDPELAAKISTLSPAKAALELGKLAASIEAKAKPKVSKAPPPVRPLGARANAGEKSLDEMSMDEYAAKRTPAILAERMGPAARQRAH